MVNCNPAACRAEINYQAVTAVYDPQHQSEWCWAACIEMLLALHGHTLTQQAIVAATYGAVVNMPAMTGATITALLNRNWIDSSGHPFHSQVTALYDAQAGVAGLPNAIVVNELTNDRPLIVGAGGHAMLLTAVDYKPSPVGPYVLAAGVFDPWPGRGARALTPPELVPVQMGGQLMYMVAANVW